MTRDRSRHHTATGLWPRAAPAYVAAVDERCSTCARASATAANAAYREGWRPAMIPTMILLGLVLGRWWRAALIAALISWPAMLLVTDVIVAHQVPAAALLALLNAAVGVAIVQVALWLYRGLRHRFA